MASPTICLGGLGDDSVPAMEGGPAFGIVEGWTGPVGRELDALVGQDGSEAPPCIDSVVAGLGVGIVGGVHVASLRQAASGGGHVEDGEADSGFDKGIGAVYDAA